MKKPSIQRLIELQQLLLEFHNIDRQVYHSRQGRKETDTEHSYSLAIAGWFLAQYFPSLDVHKVIRLALAHDLLELRAGDTFAYADPAVKQGKAAREAAGAQQLAREWNDFPELLSAIHEYEARRTAEAKFVYALDKIMPALLNYLNQGDIWRMYNINFEQFIAEKEPKVSVSPEITEYYRQLLALLQEHPDFFAPTPSPHGPED